MIAFITLIYCGLIWLLFFKLKLLPCQYSTGTVAFGR
jgi:hypothetical protein